MKKRTLLNYCGLLGIVSLLSYTAAVVFSPLAYPGYNWMAQRGKPGEGILPAARRERAAAI